MTLRTSEQIDIFLAEHAGEHVHDWQRDGETYYGSEIQVIQYHWLCGYDQRAKTNSIAPPSAFDNLRAHSLRELWKYADEKGYAVTISSGLTIRVEINFIGWKLEELYLLAANWESFNEARLAAFGEALCNAIKKQEKIEKERANK